MSLYLSARVCPTKKSQPDVTAANFFYLSPPAVLKVPVQLSLLMHRWKEPCLCEDPWWRCGDLGGEGCLSKSKRALAVSWTKGSIWLDPFCNSFLSSSDIRLGNEIHQLEKKIRNTQGCQIASFWVNVCFSAKQHELGGRPSRSSGPFMDKPRPGQESEPPVRRPPMEIVGEQNRRTIGDQRLLLAKTRMCKTSTLSEIWLVPIFCFFLLFDQTASHFFPFPIFNHDELKRSLTHPSLALTNMQHSR